MGEQLIYSPALTTFRLRDGLLDRGTQLHSGGGFIPSADQTQDSCPPSSLAGSCNNKTKNITHNQTTDLTQLYKLS